MESAKFRLVGLIIPKQSSQPLLLNTTQTLTPPSEYGDDNHAWILSVCISFKWNMITGWQQQHNDISCDSISMTGTPTICHFNSLSLSPSFTHIIANHTPTHTHKQSARSVLCSMHRFPQLILWSEALIWGKLLCSQLPQGTFGFYYLSLSVTGPRREWKAKENKIHLLLIFHTPTHNRHGRWCDNVSVIFNWSVLASVITLAE